MIDPGDPDDLDDSDDPNDPDDPDYPDDPDEPKDPAANFFPLTFWQAAFRDGGGDPLAGGQHHTFAFLPLYDCTAGKVLFFFHFSILF